MTVRQRQRTDANGKAQSAWVVDVDFEHPDGRRERVRKTSPVNTRRGAEAFERELRQSLLTGARGQALAEVPTLEAFHEHVLIRSRVSDKPSTTYSKRQILKAYLLPEFGRLRLDAIDAERLDAFKADLLDEEFAPKSINNILTVLRTALELAVEYKRIASVPLGSFWMRVPKQKFDFLDFDEADRLVANADPVWRSLVIIALHTGLRMGELQGLQWDAVDLVAGRLRVLRSLWRGQMGGTKNHREREVPLNGTAVAAFKQVLTSKLRGPFVFSYAADSGGNDCLGRPFHNSSMRNGILRQARLAGLRPIGWHTLRHSFASHLVMRGVPLKAVQELLGHQSLEMTMRYAHLSPDVRKDAVAALERHTGGTQIAAGA